jgi:DedD protein
VAPAAKPKPKPEPVPPLVKAPPPPRSAPAATATDAGAEPKAAPKPKAEATADAKAGGFVVQVAALADAEKVKELQARISEAGLKTYTEPVATAKGTVTRVRAGPFATRPAAEEAREKLKAIGLAGTVIAR